MKIILLIKAIFCFILLTFYGHAQGQDKNEEKKKGVDIFITQSPKIIILLDESVHNNCYGEGKGAINITPKGGFPPYKYYWSHGATTQDIAELQAGVYKVAVSDGYSCSDTMQIEIKHPEKLEARVVETKDVLCYGYNQGVIDVEVSGGVRPYQFSWSNGAKTEDLNGVRSGEYSLLITDANNCQEIVVAKVEEKPLIVRSFDNVSGIKCFGEATGSVTLSIEGGIPPYTFEWSHGATTRNLENVKAGSYDVTVTDAAGCTEVYTATVEEPAQLVVDLDQVRNVRCFGDEGGAINIGVVGGVPPYRYLWSDGETTQDLSGVPSGVYSVTVEDANGCTRQTEAEITQPKNLILELESGKDVSYNGGKDGSIDISVSGGLSPYKFKWNNDAVTEDISNLPSGDYSVKITDASGCSKFLHATLEQPEVLTARIDRAVHIKCFGDKSGELSLTINGGVRPYKLLWNTGATESEITGLEAGAYSVSIVDANNHEVKIDTALLQPEEFITGVSSVKNILCNGASEGAIDLEVSGGVPPYKYYWSNGMVSQDILDVPSGSYSVKILDANRCLQTFEVDITEPEVLGIMAKNVTDVQCNDDASGSIDINVTGGEKPYKFQWSNGNKLQNLSGVKSGTYQVTVEDANGCSAVYSGRVTQPEPLIIREEQAQAIDCYGSEIGFIKLSVSGGITPYKYLWSNGDSTKNIAQLKAGDYKVMVTDKNGCQAVYSKKLTSPDKLMVKLEQSKDNVCFGDANGAIDISVTGGKTPYRYRWSSGPTSQDVGSLKSGTYAVEVTDANGCSDSLMIEIKEPKAVSVEISSNNVKCNGDATGAIDLKVAGGIAPYTYEWSHEANTQDLKNLRAGQYSVIVSDKNGCSVQRDVQITEPSRFIAILESETQIKCFGESTGGINVRVSGGVNPYNFKWSNGRMTQNNTNIPEGNYQLTVSDANGCVEQINSTISQPTEVKSVINKVTDLNCFGDNSGAIDISITGGVGSYKYLWSNGVTTQDLVNVPAGKYTVQITEGNGCTNTLEAEVNQPSLLKLQLDTVAHIACSGNSTGSIDISVSGGVPPYKYSWSNGASTPDISGLAAGNYGVTVSDAHGCVKSASTVVKEPAPFIASIREAKNVLCNGESTGGISINVSGGIKPYRFAWNNGTTTQNLENLKAGNYSVEIFDAMGCSQQLNAVISQPQKLVTSLLSVSNVSCAAGKTGAINIAVTGGKAPYKYKWSNGADTQDLNYVGAGTYSVQVLDANGCLNSTIEATVTEPSPLEASILNVTHISTYGLSEGAINLAISGGVTPYSYSWSNGSKTKDINSTPAGNYSVFISDANNCELSLSTTIDQPPQLKVEVASIQNIKCFGEETGAINVNVSGGVNPYTYAWNNGDTTANLVDVGAGDYALTVIDSKNHRKVITSKISEPTGLTVKIDQIKHVKIFGNKTGAIELTVTGGLPPYSYNWSNGETNQDIDDLSAGAYQMTVADQNGCSRMLNVNIEEPEKLEAVVEYVENIDCNGENSGAIRLNVQGGVKPYQFVWNNGEKTRDIEETRAGQYDVKIKDANGSSVSLKSFISEPPALKAEITEIIHNACYGDKMGAVSLSVSGGTGRYSYSWSNGDTTQNLSNLAAGEYDVIIRDSLGCEQRLAAIVAHPEKLFAGIDNIKNIKCNGGGEGKVKVDVNGGTTPYRFRWSNGSESMNLENVGAGYYTLDIYDANECYVRVEATIAEPPPLKLNLDTVLHNLCQNDQKGLIDITISGGIKPYRHSWSNGEKTEDLVDIGAGNYQVVVKDANGCTQELAEEVEEPRLLSIFIDSIGHVACSGDQTGYIQVRAEGGVAPYDFTWSNSMKGSSITGLKSGEYEATLVDANGCVSSLKAFIKEPRPLISSINAVTDIQCFGDTSGAIYVTALEGVPPFEYEWSNGATTRDLTGITAGDYRLKVIQGNGCISYLQASVEQPESFEYKIVAVKHVECYDDTTGSIDIEVVGGVPPYTYSWSNGAVTQDISSVKADNYSVMIVDVNGCLLTATVDIEQPKELALTIDSVRNVKCCGDTSGAIFISVSGGVTPYQYRWSNGETTQDIQNLGLGKYTVTVTDALGCVVSSPDDGDLDIYQQVLTAGKFITRGIQFDVGRATIRTESFGVVNKIATVMKKYPELTFRIEGHTDSDGSAESNLDLSKNRAAAIKEALVKFGISPNRLQTEGYGETIPIASNLTQAGKQENRRVEFISLTGNLSGELEGIQ